MLQAVHVKDPLAVKNRKIWPLAAERQKLHLYNYWNPLKENLFSSDLSHYLFFIHKTNLSPDACHLQQKLETDLNPYKRSSLSAKINQLPTTLDISCSFRVQTITLQTGWSTELYTWRGHKGTFAVAKCLPYWIDQSNVASMVTVHLALIIFNIFIPIFMNL